MNSPADGPFRGTGIARRQPTALDSEWGVVDRPGRPRVECPSQPSRPPAPQNTHTTTATTTTRLGRPWEGCLTRRTAWQAEGAQAWSQRRLREALRRREALAAMREVPATSA